MCRDRIERLRAMLSQVDGPIPGSSVRQTLESRTTGPRGTESLEVLRQPGMEALEATVALESLDLLRRDGELDADQQFALEAIVMPLYRPVIDVVGDYIVAEQLTTTWKSLADESRRQWTIDRIMAVGRINVPGIAYAGTGFIVGPGLVMTNRHVACIFAQGLGSRIDFQPGQSAEINFYHEKGGTKTEELNVEEVVMIHPLWDMALLKISGLPSSRRPLTLSTADPTTLKDRRIVVIGYPGYDPFGDEDYQRVQNRIFRGTYYTKRFQPGTLRVCEGIKSYGRSVDAITHDSSTLGGNSGSAVIDVETGEVVGLHFAGAYLVANYAVPTFSLAQDSRVVDAGVSFGGSVEPRRDYYGPLWAEVAGGTPRAAELPVAHAVLKDLPGQVDSPRGQMPQLGVTLHPDGNAAATVVIPLRVSISIGAPSLDAAPAGVPGPVAAPPTEGMFSRSSPVALSGRFLVDQLKANRFSWKNALSMSLASRLTYEAAEAIRDTALASWELKDCRVIDADYTRCFVASSTNAVVVAFRGTARLGDWLANLDVISTTRGYGTVHRGFLGAFQVVAEQLQSALAALNGRDLLLTGHSLGGALATIAAAEWQGTIPVKWVYTFGQPAVGKGTFPDIFAQHYAGKLFRFVNDDDIVPRVPPTYRHVGELYHFDGNGDLKDTVESAAREFLIKSAGISAESPARPRMLTEAEFDRLRSQLLEQRMQRRAAGLEALPESTLEGLFPSVRDHRIDLYIARIDAMAGRTVRHG